MVRALLIMLAVLGASFTPACVAGASSSGRPHVIASQPGSTDLTSGWQIQSSAVAGTSGAEISRPGYSTTGWLPISQPETLMASLVENGRYPNVFYSDRLKAVPTAQFDVNWWYREQ